MSRLSGGCRSWLAISALASIGGIGVGCDDRSVDAVAGHSIVDPDEIDSTMPLESNGSFERGLGQWHFELPEDVRRARDRRVRYSGEYSLRLWAKGTSGPSSAIVLQQVPILTQPAPGTQYLLSFWAKTKNLSRAVEAELKLTYADDTYQFFRGGPAGRRKGGIPPGTAPWRRFEVLAGAEDPVSSIQIFPIDSGPGRLRGKIWLDRIELHVHT
jgi:hypothetical protein